MTKDVDQYFAEGCGRCERFATPQCKVHTWTNELKLLRRIVLETGLEEQAKWGVPCYTIDGKNVVLISAFNESCTLSFMQGALLEDPLKILEKPGENSQVGRFMRFTDKERILALEDSIKAYIFEAAENEKKGLKVQTKKQPEPMPEELEEVLNSDPAYRAAFDALTPGRKRSYILHVSSAKQSKTRTSRAEKCKEKVLLGKGFNEY